jgi:hypothetical protein
MALLEKASSLRIINTKKFTMLKYCDVLVIHPVLGNGHRKGIHTSVVTKQRLCENDIYKVMVALCNRGSML